MIVQTFIALLILSVTLICDVTGTSYSNVYVESEVVPVGYYSYGTPYSSIANSRLSEINSLPSVPGYVAPCVSPCVYPAQTVAPVNPVNPSPNVLTYNAPSVPIVVAPKQEATGYEYSYVVYDENTGDHKAQRELSDGSVVRGEYSFLQPDGYVRQVQYVADDISGFNAVVKQFLPAAVEGHRKVEGHEHKESSPPCHEIKNGSLKEESEGDSGEISIKKYMQIHGKLHNKHSNEESAEKSKGHHGTSKESGEEENSKEKHHKETKKVSKEESGEESEAESHKNHTKKPKHSKEASGEESEEKSKEKPHIKPKHSKEESGEESEEKSKEKHHNKSKKVSSEHSGEESEENSKEETLHKKSKESTGESKENHHKKAKKDSKESGEESEEETDSEESKEELKEKSQKNSSKGNDESREKNKKKSKKGSKEGSAEDSGEESEEVGQGKHQEVHALLKPNEEAHVPYNDIVRCIEAAMRKNNGVPAAMRQEPSPLTYIVLNKPC